MKRIKLKSTFLSLTVGFLLVLLSVPVSAKNGKNILYEVWGADQSNSVSSAPARGTIGSLIWVWNSEDIHSQLTNGTTAQPLGCDGNNTPGDGPCDLLNVFPGTLVEHDSNGVTGASLHDYDYGRLHGALPDPQNRYMNINLFGPGNGFIGIMDGATKEAVALFRVTGTSSGQRVHMSFWNSDGSALLIANLDGKVLERIDIARDTDGSITQAAFNRSASLGVGKNLAVTAEVKVYLGQNEQGNPMIGTITGDYSNANLGDLTPAGKCRENGCISGTDGEMGGRVNNVIICPIVSANDYAYITMGGGGLLVANTRTTPMTIVGEYGQEVINGAGCGGIQVGDHMWLNAGISASAAGNVHSTFTIYTLDDRVFNTVQAENTPLPVTVYKDSDASDGNAANTATIGNLSGDQPPNLTGQLPGTSTRRDSHGMARTLSGKHVHTVDRIQNIVEVINTKTLARTTYDLASANGLGNGVGPCDAASVTSESGSTGDPALPPNDATPDLLENTPDGKYLAVALRGPIPVSVTHAAQGSCPGVGIIRLLAGGKRGKLATVLRTTNTIDDTPVSAPGGHIYEGTEHSDIHGASVRTRVEDMK
ncbi:hypothetical protein [Candidatus Nitrospira salsa]